MAVLTTQQRSTLETAVKQARKIAETGAFNALHGMAVDNSEPFAHMASELRTLRNTLWAKAKLLGDKADDGVRKIIHLTYELAYETWHKMLFAKFLEANGLLMHPDGVAVTLEDCEELANDEGFVDKWDAAASYASKMLPAIFRISDPLMQVAYASNDRIKLEAIIDKLERQIFIADDALGWVYQFWQIDAKKKVEEEEKSGQKIDGERLPAKTQLFTEPYMVHFLIDNTLGAWWVIQNKGVKPPVKFEYLRLLEDGTPAAGKLEGWPNTTKEITSLDPCMGSGHFIASLFPVFAALRMHEEGLTKAQATDKVIAENLHGLELDARCTQIAAFNLALTAWKFCGHYKELPEMNLACSGIAPKGKVEDWVKLVGKVERADDKLRLENGMKMLYEHFQLAPELGSLLDPATIKADAFTASFEELQPVLKKALESEANTEQLERGVMAAGIAKAGQVLSKKYTLQITNVPYLSRSKQDDVMANYCEKNFVDAKGDLANVFLNKMLKSNTQGGVSCSVIPQNWLFLTSYKKYRERLLKNETWSIVARLGPKSFQTPMWDFNVMLISIQHLNPSESHLISGLDVSEATNATAKDDAIKTFEVKTANQKSQLENPDGRVVIGESVKGELLSKYAKALQGIATGDFSYYGRWFWEIQKVDNKRWVFQQTTFSETSNYVGKHNIIFWEEGKGTLCSSPGARVQGLDSKLRLGIAVTQMATINATISTKTIFDNNSSIILPNKSEYLLPIWMYITNGTYNLDIRKIDQKVSVTNATLVKVPFNLDYWQKLAFEKYPNGLPKPYSDDPTQWLFHGNPMQSDNPLQVAVARVLGYRWPAENDEEMELADDARILIEAVENFDYLTDNDGIFCIPSVNAEEAGAERLRSYLKEVFADKWTNQTITQLLTKEGAFSSNIEEWLRKEFFIQHCKLFQNRPFIWHIWDGRNDGFSALVNYHKLDKDNLSKLIYTYLGDWIRLCEAKKKAEESGAEGLLSAAQKLKDKLEAILQGEEPYDIFVRWKPLEQQPIGWEPDLNDGVRLNIRPFMEADVLRKKPNIKWGVDRGRNPAGSPWGEIRDNDKHLTLEEKRVAIQKFKR
jgi:hypothetical protein